MLMRGIFFLILVTNASLEAYGSYYQCSTTIVINNEYRKNRIKPFTLKASEPNNQDNHEGKNISQYKPNNKIIKEKMHKHIILAGDTLSNILNQYGIDTNDISHLIITDNKLSNLKIGQQLSWLLTTNGNLQRLTWEISRHETRTYCRTVNGFKMSNKIQQGVWFNNVLKGTVNEDFISSAYAAGLTRSEISAVIKAMQWQMDFKKLKKGDEFVVLIAREILNGKHEQSQLVGVRLYSNGKNYYAIRAEDGKFYDRQGIGFMKNFLYFPTSKQFRVSSNFNPKRLNPITGRITPHRGVDFAMPNGTPVLAVADGEVIIAKYNHAAGYYVVVRHGCLYTTRYMHLYKLLVKPGQKVKRGDRIALSGSTGRSTGPHLHYEVWINRKAVNPLTAKLPHNEELTGKNLTEYLTQVRNVLLYLDFN